MAPRRPRTARALFAPSAIIGARVRGARRVSGRAMVPGELPAPKGRAGAASFVREAAKGAHLGSSRSRKRLLSVQMLTGVAEIYFRADDRIELAAINLQH